jgi:hypothetical protein
MHAWKVPKTPPLVKAVEVIHIVKAVEIMQFFAQAEPANQMIERLWRLFRQLSERLQSLNPSWLYLASEHAVPMKVGTNHRGQGRYKPKGAYLESALLARKSVKEDASESAGSPAPNRLLVIHSPLP